HLGRDLDRECLPESVRVDISDKDERRAAVALDVERRLEMSSPLDNRPREGAEEGEVAGSSSVFGSPTLVDAPDDLGIETDARVEREAATVRATSGDVPRPAVPERLGDLLGRLDRIAGQAERTRKHARPAAGHEAERQVVPLHAVQDLVEAAVAGEHDQRIRVARRLCELDRVAWTFGPDGANVG